MTEPYVLVINALNSLSWLNVILFLNTGFCGNVSSAEHFVDRHKVELIQRVSNVGPILDELLHKKVIQQESYDKIRALSTSQEKMRELCSGSLRAAPACKDIFYKLLEEYEFYLIEDLKKMK